MRAGLKTTQRLADTIRSKPVVAICISGRNDFNHYLKQLGLSATVRSLDFNHHEWAEATMAVTKVREEDIDSTSGLHFVKNPKRYLAGQDKVGEDVQNVLAMLFKQYKKEFVLSRKNHYIVLQDTAHTGQSLQLVKKALIMNGVPEESVTTAAFRSSISTIFPPDVCGERALLKQPSPRKSDSWLRIDYEGRDIILNVPKP